MWMNPSRSYRPLKSSSRPRKRPGGSRCGALREVEVERVEELDSRARRVHRDLRRDVEERLRVVEDDLDAGFHDVVRHLLRGVGRNREDGDDDVLVADDVAELPVGRDGRVPVPDGRADLALVGLEGGRDVEAVVGEDRRAGDRLAEPPTAEERDVVLALRAEDLADLRDQAVDRVADAPLAELAEGREVAPDLRRVDVRVLADLL